MPKKLSLKIETQKLEYIRIWIIANTFVLTLFQIYNIFRKDALSVPDKST